MSRDLTGTIPVCEKYRTALERVDFGFAAFAGGGSAEGTFRSVRDLIKAIHDYIRICNRNPRPFQLVATASGIIRKGSPRYIWFCRQPTERTDARRGSLVRSSSAIPVAPRPDKIAVWVEINYRTIVRRSTPRKCGPCNIRSSDPRPATNAGLHAGLSGRAGPSHHYRAAALVRETARRSMA